MDADTYTLSVVRQDFANHFGAVPVDDRDLLLDYLAKRAALRASYGLVHVDYVNTNAELEALLQRIAA